MISVANLKSFVTEMQNRVPALNFSELVVDDSQLTNFLKELKANQNQMLFGIIPEYPLEGNQDRLKWNNQLMFMILEKTIAKNQKHPDFLQTMENTMQTAKSFVEILLSEKSGDGGAMCGIASQLKEDSIRIYPIWNKAECNGWGIDIDLLSMV